MIAVEKNREKKISRQDAYDMLYLVSCGIEGTIPNPQRVAQMELQKVYLLSQWQSLSALTCMALELLWKKTEEGKTLLGRQADLWAKWQESKNKAIRKNLLMNTERERLCAFLEQQGIWYLPLKGSLLQDLYPVFGMRQMADNDLLFEADARQKVYDWFMTHGYSAESVNVSNHDVYHKDPVYNFEMHTSLFGEGHDPQWVEYYAAIKERLILEEGKSFGYRFSDEDFYIYMIVHEYKHYIGSGTGLRFLLDIYVYNREKEEKMDAAYVERELRTLGLSSFEKEMRVLAKKVFVCFAEEKEGSFSQQEQKQLEEFLGSATYGTIQQFVKNRLKQLGGEECEVSMRTKLRYVKSRLFPDKTFMKKWCQAYAPVFVKHAWMMPAAWMFRIATNGIRGRKKYQEELQAVRKE